MRNHGTWKLGEDGLPLAVSRLTKQLPGDAGPYTFYDLNSMFSNALDWHSIMEEMEQAATRIPDFFAANLIVGLEARGFALAGALALETGMGYLPIRKKGKLQGEVISESYNLEYGTDTIEIDPTCCYQKRVVVVDDVLATGGTLAAAERLIERAGGELIGHLVLVEIGLLAGRSRLSKPVAAVWKSI